MSTITPTTPHLGSLASIMPPQYIVFDTRLNTDKESTAIIVIKNTTVNPIAFKIKVADRSRFRCKPYKGALMPNASKKITLTLLRIGELIIFKDQVLIMIAMTPRLLNSSRIDAFFHDNEKDGVFNQKNLMKHLLHCALNVDYVELNKQIEKEREARKLDPLFPLPYEALNFSHNAISFNNNNAGEADRSNETRGVVFAETSQMDKLFKMQKYPEAQDINEDNLNQVLTHFRETDMRLKKHINYFRVFQLFIFMAVVGMCCVLVVMTVKMSKSQFSFF